MILKPKHLGDVLVENGGASRKIFYQTGRSYWLQGGFNQGGRGETLIDSGTLRLRQFDCALRTVLID